MQQVLLLIDDGENIALLMERIAKQLLPEVRIISAKTGKEGLQKAKSEVPDIILLDVKLPDLDGFEVGRRLRVESQTKSTPILMLSGVAREETDVMKGMKAGVNDYMFKPFSATELVARIKLLLPKHKPPIREEPTSWLKRLFSSSSGHPTRLALTPIDVAAVPVKINA
jgi:DNA-binding response OmpR family regulator